MEQPPPTPPTVVEQDTTPVLADDAPKTKPARSAPKWETEARDAVKAAIKRFAKPLADLVARDANEGDTRLLVTDLLCDGLGYDKYADLTTEYAVKGDFADYGIRIDKELVAFVETKRAATKLGVKHLRQVEMYAVNEGVEWLILTNGADWQVYHVTGGLPVKIDLAFKINLLSEATVAQKAAELFYLHRESFKRRQIDELWKAKAATSPAALGAALLSEPVISALRRELRRATGHQVDETELGELLRATVLRPECFG